MEERLYYSVKEAAQQCDVDFQWLRQMIAGGRLPKRWYGRGYVVSDLDFDAIRELSTVETIPDVKYYELERVGYSVGKTAELTGASEERIEALARDGQIQAQQFGDGWIVFPVALDFIRSLPVVSKRQEDLDYRTSKDNPMRIPPLSETWKAIVKARLAGDSFAEIARELGVSRERTSKVFATVKRRVVLLQQRGIVSVADIAQQLDIDIDTAIKLIEQVNDANK